MKKEIEKQGNYIIDLDLEKKDFIVSEIIEEQDEPKELKIFSWYNDALEYIKNREERKAKAIIKKKEPLLCLFRNWRYDNFIEGKITSYENTGYGNSSVWITSLKDNSRGKWSASEILKLTEENKEKLIKIESLNQEIDKVKASLERWTKEELNKYFNEEN